MSSADEGISPRQPDGRETPDKPARDTLDFIDQTVAGITDADVNQNLRNVLDQSGYRQRDASRAQKAPARDFARVAAAPSPGYEVPESLNYPPESFWASLSQTQQHVFAQSATQRTFAAGATLMEEGETAEHVVVILVGRTKISVWDGDTEQTIAVRGPGDLIGERAALRVSVRSATVVALEQVQALVTTTEDFASFLSRYPDALQLVEDQIYERLTRDSARRYRDHMRQAWETGRAMVPRFGRLAGPRFSGENCTVVFTDVVAFGARTRDDEDRLVIRRELQKMTSEALQLIQGRYYWEDRGDGHLIVVPPDIPTVQVLGNLSKALPDALNRHNLVHGMGAQIQLKVALDVGPVTGDRSNASGQVIINTARYLDAPPLKKAMADSRATIGFVVSDFVFQSAVSLAESPTDPGDYSSILVRLKEMDQKAWMLLLNPTSSASALSVGSALSSARGAQLGTT